MALNFGMSSALAELLEAAFATRPASEWEEALSAEGIPCLKVITWDEFKRDPEARSAHIFARAKGHKALQLGRPSWVASAQPYPDLAACKHLDFPARAQDRIAFGQKRRIQTSARGLHARRLRECDRRTGLWPGVL